MRPIRHPNRLILAGGDVLVLALVTLAGFARHGEAGNFPRMASTFLPLVAGWGLVAPWLALYDGEKAADTRNFWRPALAALLAAPFAAWLRGLWLGADVDTIFVLVIAAVTAGGMTIWRCSWAWFFTHQKVVYG